MGEQSVDINKERHRLYDEYKRLDRRFKEEALKAWKNSSSPYEDKNIRANLKKLDNEALEAYKKWRDYRFQNAHQINLEEDE